MITFRAIGLTDLIQRTLGLHASFDTMVVAPSLKELYGKIWGSTKIWFSTRSQHKNTGAYMRNLMAGSTRGRIIDSFEIGEGVTSVAGEAIRQGTRGQIGVPVAPYGTFNWAKTKLSLSDTDAWKVAAAVARRGTGKTGPLAARYKSGKPGFQWPEYVVKVKHKSDINEVSKRVEKLFVSYMG